MSGLAGEWRRRWVRVRGDQAKEETNFRARLDVLMASRISKGLYRVLARERLPILEISREDAIVFLGSPWKMLSR